MDEINADSRKLLAKLNLSLNITFVMSIAKCAGGLAICGMSTAALLGRLDVAPGAKLFFPAIALWAIVDFGMMFRSRKVVSKFLDWCVNQGYEGKYVRSSWRRKDKKSQKPFEKESRSLWSIERCGIQCLIFFLCFGLPFHSRASDDLEPVLQLVLNYSVLFVSSFFILQLLVDLPLSRALKWAKANAVNSDSATQAPA